MSGSLRGAPRMETVVGCRRFALFASEFGESAQREVGVDILMVGIIVSFFLLTWGLVELFDRLGRDERRG